jgi:hypothetical protein
LNPRFQPKRTPAGVNKSCYINALYRVRRQGWDSLLLKWLKDSGPLAVL